MQNEELGDIEEVDVLSLLANESDNEGDEDPEDEEIQEKTETPEALKARLDKRTISLRRSKKAQVRTLEENKLLKNRLDELERRVAGSQSNVEAEKNEQDAQDWRDRVKDDPSLAPEYTDWRQAQLEDRIASYIGSKFQQYEVQLGQLNSAVDPEVVRYRDKIAALRRKEGFSELDEDTLLKVVKGFDGAKMIPRDGIGGQKPTAKPAEKKFVLTKEQRDAMGF